MRYFIFVSEDDNGFRSVWVEKVQKSENLKAIINQYESYINIVSIWSCPETKRDAEEIAQELIEKYKAKGIYKEI